MKSNLKKKGLLTILGCLMFSIAMMFGAMFSEGSFVAFASETDDKLAPAIVSTGGIAVKDGFGNLPSAIVNEEYKDTDGNNYKIIANGTKPLTYSAREYTSVNTNCMPQGLHLNSETGEFSGTITETGTFSFSVSVSNEYGSHQVRCYLNVYDESQKPVITTESLPAGAVGSAYYQCVSYEGLKSALDVSLKSGNLPTGLSLGRSGFDAVISGTPTQAGSYTFTLSMNNGAGIATKEYTIEIKEEVIAPELIKSATTVNASDKYSFIDSTNYINVVQGKPVNIQLVASGTNTTDNPIKYSLVGTLPEGLTLSETGLISGTPADSIDTSSGNKYFTGIGIKVENTSALGMTQSSNPDITIIVWKNGYIEKIAISPSSTSVAKGGTRQFEAQLTGYGDFDKTTGVTWQLWTPTTSKNTTISNTGLLTVGLDEEKTSFEIRATHSYSGTLIANATITVVDHEHTTTLVAKVDKTCEADGCDKHYKCTICDAVFEDALATQSTTLETLKIAKGHEYGELITEVPATCSNKGKKAHYKCSVCEKLFTSEKVEATETDLVIAIVPTAHKFGIWQNEVPANCATEGTKAHKTCEYCHKNFDNDGTEITDLTIAKNEEHLKQTEWSKDGTGHWHACTRTGCKDGGKLDYAEHTKSAEEPTETTDVHCTVCGYVIQAETGHIHNFETVSGKAKTCIEDGWKSYYRCSCGNYEDNAGTRKIEQDIDTWKVIPAGHEFGDWQNEVPATTENTGTKGHKDCSVCHKHFDNEDNEIDDLTIPKLTVPTDPTDPTDPVTPTDPTEPTEPTKPSEEKNKSLSGGAIAGIVVGSVAVAGIGGFAIFWFVIKKKKWADLVAIFKKLFKKN